MYNVWGNSSRCRSNIRNYFGPTVPRLRRCDALDSGHCPSWFLPCGNLRSIHTQGDSDLALGLEVLKTRRYSQRFPRTAKEDLEEYPVCSPVASSDVFCDVSSVGTDSLNSRGIPVISTSACLCLEVKNPKF